MSDVEEAQRWAAFARRLMLAFAVLTVLLGAGLTGLSALNTKTFLEANRIQRGQIIADMAARAAFVPMSLEDRRALGHLAASFNDQKFLASLRVVDPQGEEWARLERPSPKSSALVSVSAPISVPDAGPGTPPLGRVEIIMDLAGIRAALIKQIGISLAVSSLFAALILGAGFFMIGKLTRGMRDLAREAARAEDLARSNRDLEEFAYIASHDLQAPLRRITGFAQLLVGRYRGRLDPDADDFLDRIVVGTNRMQTLILDLLTYSRVGSRQLEPASIDVSVVLNEVLADLDPILREAGATVTAGPLPVLIADRGSFSRLLQNLIGNAVKFRGTQPPVVRISATRSGSAWVFSVSDNGIGIEPRYASDIFKMFRRLHNAAEYPGTGIGLAVARKIVERHGGRIWAESEPGKGSTFYFTIESLPEKGDPK